MLRRDVDNLGRTRPFHGVQSPLDPQRREAAAGGRVTLEVDNQEALLLFQDLHGRQRCRHVGRDRQLLVDDDVAITR